MQLQNQVKKANNMDINSLADLLNKKKEEDELMSTNRNIEMIPPAQPEAQAPVIPDNTPLQEVISTPKLSDVLPEKAPEMQMAQQQPQVPMLAEAEKPAMSKTEQLLEEYRSMLGKDRQSLEEARKRDRMLKIGGALGDALATVINAQGQMNVKAPGVQVQQGAGLGKIAEMFATSPEIASDIKSRQQALLDQYKQMATGELKAADRALKERQVAAYEAQTKAQAKKAEADTAKESKKETEKLTVGEETVDREFAKKFNTWSTQGKADYEENSKILKEAIGKLEKGKVSTGFLEGIGAKTPGIRTETRELETRVRKALNGMLRATLGAQFTEEEGNRIFEQTFDPAASPQENIKNMQTELNKLEKQKTLIENQGKVFKEKGTLRGYEVPQTSEQNTTTSNTIIRLDPKSGRKVEYDATTKKPIRFVD